MDLNTTLTENVNDHLFNSELIVAYKTAGACRREMGAVLPLHRLPYPPETGPTRWWRRRDLQPRTAPNSAASLQFMEHLQYNKEITSCKHICNQIAIHK